MDHRRHLLALGDVETDSIVWVDVVAVPLPLLSLERGCAVVVEEKEDADLDCRRRLPRRNP